ncbi:MAG: long-chain-acyl-CoA synthetase [Ketobacter sp.]|nr:MAG: long-chain-acyl-CoA synthetase [Ketobacter sp.]
MNANKQVSLSEITSGILRAVPDAPAFVAGVRSMLNAGPDKKMSIGLLLEKQARRHPASPALKFEDKVWSYAGFNGWVNRIAALYQQMGVGEGDVVAIMSENRPAMLACTAAAVKLGAIAGMINYNQRDEVLVHSLGLIKPKIMVVGQESVAALDDTEYSPLQNQTLRYLWLGEDPEQCPLGYEELETQTRMLPSVNPETTGTILSKQACFYIFTSGTTGMPKASVMSHGRWLKGGAGMGLLTARMSHEDTIYVPLPLYHNNALTVSWGSALASGACVALTKKFSVSRFWDEVRQHDATAFCYIGELCRYLLNQAPSPQDRQHKVRVVIGNGLRPEIWMEFKERFGIERVCEFYGASECNLAFVNSFDVDCTAGFCPLPFAVVECDPETEQPVRGDDGRMRRVATGGVGLLITKINRLAPFDGYTDASASEKKLLRNVFKDGDTWFNTGDLVRDQGFKHIQFVDRLGDTFRWKGENVATTEVEAAFKHVDQIEQAVVYGVQVPNADGRAGMAAITLHGSVEEFDGKSLAQTLMSSLPAYAVPLFVRVRDEHEITGTFKNRKVELKKEGFDPELSADPVFMLDPKAEAYVPLTPDHFQQIQRGEIRL